MKKKSRNSVKIAALVVVVCVVIAAMFGIQKWKDGQEEKKEEESSVDVEDKLAVIQVNGVTYKQKGDIRCYVLMGIDHADQQDVMERGNFGQNDLLLAIVVNDTNKTYQILQMNRDSMVDVIQIDQKGNEVGTVYEQICLAHSFGDGKQLSDENVVNTLSKTLWDQPFEGYVALNMDAVNILADDVGGVPVQVNDDFSEIDPSLVQGTTVTLTSANALTFVRSRYNVADETNMNRQARQQEFMNSFINKASSLSDKQLEDMYQTIQNYRESDMSSSGVVNLMVKLKKYKELPLKTIDGTNSINQENNTNEYKMDNASLQSVILELFYNKQD